MEENLQTLVSNRPVAVDLWQIEGLISRAFNRAKDRLVSYFLALVLSFLISVSIVVVFLLVGGFFLFLVSLTRQPLLIGSFVFLLLTLFLVSLYYLSALSALLTTQVIIQDRSGGVMESLKNVWPSIWSYVWLLFLISLFMTGLLPLGLLSLGIILVLWSFWSSFNVFIFLEKRKGGLYSLWLSKTLIDQRFWGVAGRLLLLNAAVIFVALILGASKNSFLEIASFVWGLFAAPFLLSFGYEIYRLLPQPEEVKRPTGWVVLSLTGLVLMVVSSVFLIGAAITAAKNFDPNYYLNLYKSVQNQPGISPSLLNNLNLQNPPNPVLDQSIQTL